MFHLIDYSIGRFQQLCLCKMATAGGTCNQAEANQDMVHARHAG